MENDKLVDFDHVTDYISREAALSCFSDWIDRYGHEHTADEMVEYQRIEELPAADVVEVVRCKDCQHYNPEATDWRCDIVTGLVEPYDDDFCSYGERRAGNG